MKKIVLLSLMIATSYTIAADRKIYFRDIISGLPAVVSLNAFADTKGCLTCLAIVKDLPASPQRTAAINHFENRLKELELKETNK